MNLMIVILMFYFLKLECFIRISCSNFRNRYSVAVQAHYGSPVFLFAGIWYGVPNGVSMESPDIPFTVFWIRFKRGKLIISFLHNSIANPLKTYFDLPQWWQLTFLSLDLEGWTWWMDVPVMFFNIKYVLQRFTMSQSPLSISNLLTALEVVIYDNAYNLHKYCLNRDLWFFAVTKFGLKRPGQDKIIFICCWHQRCSKAIWLTSLKLYTCGNKTMTKSGIFTLSNDKTSSTTLETVV